MIMTIFLSCLLFVNSAYAKNVSVRDNTLIMDYSITTDYNRNDDFSTNCQDFAHTIRIFGYILLLAKILIPLVMIVKASLNLIGVITKGDAGEVNKYAKKLGTMIAGGVIIFFIPTIISVLFGFISGFNSNMTADAKVCTACIFEPYSSTCSKYAD